MIYSSKQGQRLADMQSSKLAINSQTLQIGGHQSKLIAAIINATMKRARQSVFFNGE